MAQAGALLRGSAAFDRSSIAQGLNPERAVGGDVADDLCCPICSNVVAFGAASYTPCHHVYCATCLAEWMERGKATCPSCNSHMETGSVRMLQEAAPVVHRLLGKLQVTCSFEGCTWKGDYSTLTEHEERCAATNTWHCPACQQQLPNAEQGAHVAACLAPQYEELHRRFQVLSRAQLALQCETDALAKRLKDVQLDMDQAMQCLQQHHQLQQPLQELQQHQERQQLPPEPAQLPSPQQAQHQQRHEQDQHVTQGQQHKQKRKQQQKQQHHQHHQHHQQQQQARETRGEDADQQEQQQLLQARALHEKKALEAAVLLLKERAGPDTGQRYKKLMKLLKKKSPPSHGIEGASPFAWGVVVMDELQCLIRNYSSGTSKDDKLQYQDLHRFMSAIVSSRWMSEQRRGLVQDMLNSLEQ